MDTEKDMLGELEWERLELLKEQNEGEDTQ